MMRITPLNLLAITVLTTLSSMQARAEEAPGQLKVRGFVDAQYKWQKSQDRSTGAVINDGAIYFTHSSGPTELFVDLPFFWAGAAAGTDADGNGQPDSGNASFVVGAVKPQAYIAHTAGPLKIQVGQFDTIYGLELNDSPDIVFTTQGIHFANVLPLTHTGALASYTAGPVIVKALAGNSVAGKGDSGAQLRGKGEFGATIGFANETLRAGAGYLTGMIVGLKDKKRDFIDLLAGATFGPLAIDAEYSTEKIADQDQGSSFVILPVYGISSELSAALRYEQQSKVAGADKITQFTGGFQYKASEALKLKVDYTSNKTTPVSGSAVDDSGFAVAAVYKL